MPEEVSAGLLAPIPLLEGVEPKRLEEVAASMWLRHAQPGEVLAHEGDPGATFGLVLEGRVEVSRLSLHGSTRLAEAGAGSLLGELAVLRRQPRTATLTALTDAFLAVGDERALRLLLDTPEVHERIRLLASARLARDLRPVRARLRDGTVVLVRPLLAEDRDAFDQELHRLSQDSLRRRFFSPAPPSESMVDYLVHIDYVDHFAWVVLDADDPRQGLATARFVRLTEPGTAEMAFGTVDRYQGRGIGTFLLGAIGVAATEAGITTLMAHVLEDNHPMRAVFAKVEGDIRFDEPGVLMVEIEAATAAGLLDDRIRRELASNVRDVVTAASLALATPTGRGQETPSSRTPPPGGPGCSPS
jgi:protein lysine acetyltransferase